MAQKENKPKKPNFFVALFSELKQVSWLSFGETMKRLGAVLVVTLAFLLVMIGFDALLGFIHEQLFSVLGTQQYLTGSQIAAVVVSLSLIVVTIVGYVVYRVIKAKKAKEAFGRMGL